MAIKWQRGALDSAITLVMNEVLRDNPNTSIARIADAFLAAHPDGPVGRSTIYQKIAKMRSTAAVVATAHTTAAGDACVGVTDVVKMLREQLDAALDKHVELRIEMALLKRQNAALVAALEKQNAEL